jgi:hypothetical protein
MSTLRLNNWLQNAITPGIEEVALCCMGKITTSHAQFYIMGVGIRFGIFTSPIVPSDPWLDLIACEVLQSWILIKCALQGMS